MSVTVPDWADTLLDLIGVAWPNVDEDAYRDMADARREFADDLEDDGQVANNHFERLLSSGKGESIEALRARPALVNIIATGRDAPEALIEVADTVTEMVNVRHAYDRGIRARRGIEGVVCCTEARIDFCKRPEGERALGEARALAPGASRGFNGYETGISTSSTHASFAIQALNSSDRVLGNSAAFPR